MSHHLHTKALLRGVLILFIVWLFFAGIYFAQPFLVPLAYASLLAMLLWPICRRLESWGINRKIADLLCILLLVATVAGIFFLLSNQIAGFTNDWPQLKQNFLEKVEVLQNYVQNKFGIAEQRQENLIDRGKGSATSYGKAFASSFFVTLTQALLTLVYLFLLLLYRTRLKLFVLKYTADGKKEKARQVITRSANVAKDYLAGRLLLMSILAVVYCVGLSVIGVRQAIFFGVLAALLSIIPYIGNIIGAILPLAVALLYQGTTAALGVVGLFTAAQLLENYLLEPLVVGKKVNLNGLFAIAVVVLGEIVWGVSGAILAMPFLGIAKIIFDNTRQLKPFGYLVGEDDEEEEQEQQETAPAENHT